MAKNYTITKEEGIKRICEAIREAYAISDAIDDEHLATNSTFSSVNINSLLNDIDTRVDKLEKDIVTDLIQCGTVSGTTISITFDKSFKDTPTVVCTACNSSPSAYYISNKSTTGFTITSNASQTYDWIAIGDAATE